MIMPRSNTLRCIHRPYDVADHPINHCRFNGMRFGWDGLGRHLATWCTLLILSSGGAAASGLPEPLIRAGFLYLTTEALAVFEQDYARSPSRQTAGPWLAFTVLYRCVCFYDQGNTMTISGTISPCPVS